ncbi:MAG: hypothetical protein BWY82_01657 [Verrucomicrobia bacterium ADurb.Bin474]|nr:MAG: hypothetical protein BWY82_01657 [Verrucomicrobia bacterium ADurb.Bin474]
MVQGPEYHLLFKVQWHIRPHQNPLNLLKIRKRVGDKNRV